MMSDEFILLILILGLQVINFAFNIFLLNRERKKYKIKL